MRQHINNISTEIEHGGWRGLLEFTSRLFHRKLQPERPGTPIWDREWDVLVILDACRYDLMERVYQEFRFLTEPEGYRSVGSNSIEWMNRTFSSSFESETASTTYITANPFSDQLISEDQFKQLEEVWRYGWNRKKGDIPPRPVTDTAISVGRSTGWNRLIVHYMQPHVPFLIYKRGDVTRSEFQENGMERVGKKWNEPLHELQRGELSLSKFWEYYESNLRLVLEDVDLLLNNISAEKVVISSDHGNALGERWLYGHPGGVDLPCLRRIPWMETTATENYTHEPADYEMEESIDVSDRLAALGYQ